MNAGPQAPESDPQDPPPADAGLRDLVPACLRRIDEQGESGLEAFCAEHPAHAAGIRALISRLGRLGLIQNTRGAKDGPPERLGGFRLLEKLGGGGMGVVYAAEQVDLGRQVALKLIRSDQLYFEGSRERFRREVLAVARLQHPGIVPIYTVGEDQGVPYFAMERVIGCSLADALAELSPDGAGQRSGEDLFRAILARTSGAGPETAQSASYVFEGSWSDTCLRIALQAAGALEHAHQKEILHRDVKPSNLMITPAGRVMLLDFGLASAQGEDKLTRTGSALGSLSYMSPEQVRGEFGALDARSDVYSLGVTLYEMLTLRAPFGGKSAPATVMAILAGSPERPSAVDPSIPWDVETVCLTAMDRDPARRYASMGDFARDLDNALARRPIEAERAGIGLRVRRWSERNPAWAVGILLGALLLGGAPTALYLQQARANREIAGKNVALEEALARARNESERAERNAEEARLQASNAESARAAEADQRRLAEERAAEVQEVADFQARMLDELSPDEFGQSFVAGLRAEIQAGEQRIHASAPAAAEVLPGFDAAITLANATNVARLTLSQQVLAPAASAIDERFGEHLLLQAALRASLAQAANRWGILDLAEPAARAALAARRAELGEEDPSTLRSMRELAQILRNAGQLTEAEELVRTASERCARTLGADHVETLHAQEVLAKVLRSEGQLEEAEALGRSVLSACRRVLGDDHELTLSALIAFVRTLSDANELDEAEPLAREAVERSRRVLGAEHADTMIAINALAGLLQAQARYAEAEPLCREELEVSRRKLGDDHPNTLAALERLSQLAHDQGRLGEAKTLSRSAVEGLRRALGEDHPVTLRAQANLGSLLAQAGEFAEAEALLARSLAGLQQQFGPRSPRTLEAAGTLAMTLWQQGKLAAAERAYRGILDDMRAAFGADHPRSVATASGLALVLQGLGKLDEAEPLTRECVEQSRRTQGPDHPLTLTKLNNLAVLLRAKGQLADAERVCREVLEARQRTLGPEHPDTLASLGNLGVVVHAQGRLAEAEELQRATLAGRRQVLGADHPMSLRAQYDLGGCLLDQKRWSEAEALLVEVVDRALAGAVVAGIQREVAIRRLAGFYASWETAEPGQGHDEKARLYRAQLPSDG